MTKEELEIMAKISAVNARVQGMIAANAHRERTGEAQAYDEQHFFQCESELEDIAHLARQL